MARDEAHVRVRLDTGQAKGDVRELTNVVSEASGRIGGGLRSALGKGFRAAGLGAGLGAGVGAIRGSVAGGAGDIARDVFDGLGEMVNDFFLGSIDDQARANIRAKQETIETFKHAAGATGATPSGAVPFFNARASRYLDEERGRSILKREVGPDLEDIIQKIVAGLGAEIKAGIDKLLEGIPFLGGR